MSRICSPLAEGENQFKKPVETVRKRRKSLRRVGKKGAQWAKIRAELKIRFAAIGLTSCELKYVDCFHDNHLGFAHAKKRADCSPEDLWVVILACNACHDVIEKFDKKLMEHIVMHTINMRVIQP